ncbi:hypothetical protein L2E82_09152 [Cichorium intybus]|uniref:Uncharacterized protein n=1 Tax=Cichorium intybus TaxID=13427 RepID=A0ACB9G8P4_CICIN|nr:hypothetical protein L2E82_09152 [Cichorium intybus]
MLGSTLPPSRDDSLIKQKKNLVNTVGRSLEIAGDAEKQRTIKLTLVDILSSPIDRRRVVGDAEKTLDLLIINTEGCRRHKNTVACGVIENGGRAEAVTIAIAGELPVEPSAAEEEEQTVATVACGAIGHGGRAEALLPAVSITGNHLH